MATTTGIIASQIVSVNDTSLSANIPRLNAATNTFTGNITLSAGNLALTGGGINVGAGGSITNASGIFFSGGSGYNFKNNVNAQVANLTEAGYLGIGGSPAGPLDVVVGQGVSSGTVYGTLIRPTWTNSGTAGYTAIQVTSTETSLGSGSNLLMDLWSGSPPTSKLTVKNSGVLTAPAIASSGLTGATAFSQYRGATTGGAPVSGTAAVGEFVIDQTGALWVCTTAGTPGTWSKVGGGAQGIQPSVRTFNSADISIPASTDTILTFDTNRFDQGTSSAQHSTVTNTSRLTCRVAGIYQVTTHVRLQATSATGWQLWIQLNGTTRIAHYFALPNGAAPNGTSLTTLYKLNVNDFLEVGVQHNAAVAQNINTANDYSPNFMWVKVSD